ncbi:unnamed protein product [Chilo suppressalis]|uniref:Mos1 transposase HTH domain-containing protein n=1 Tax=Chilo suppressalis TaxID=168631 RepID=A0ABN8AZB2_CHISP|nr:unnamed protein product [Chilo suppressalis]
MKKFSRLKKTTIIKVYAHSSKEAAQVVGKVQRGHHPASVMVWWGVSYQGVTKLSSFVKKE